MSFSANEVTALATKAARGAGADMGQAAAFGAACAGHLAADRDPAQISAALDALPAGPIHHGPLVCRQAARGADTVTLRANMPVDLARSYLETLPKPVTCTLLSSTGDSHPASSGAEKASRIDLPRDLLTHLNRLAQETYVPNTEASRAAGAGAGLTDND